MAAILIFLGSVGVLLVLRHASDGAFVSWGIVLLCVNLWISEKGKAERRGSAGENSGSRETGAGHRDSNPV